MGHHTQGPWIINLDPRYPSEPCIDAVIDGVVWHVALCHNAAGPEDGSAEANARLIAAAPELLATLRAVLPALRADVEKQSANGASTLDSSSLRVARARYEAAVRVLAKIDGQLPQPTERRSEGH
jgi:hypothetical protein